MGTSKNIPTGFSSQFLEVYLKILLRRIFVSYCITITYENTRRVSLKTNKGFFKIPILQQ